MSRPLEPVTVSVSVALELSTGVFTDVTDQCRAAEPIRWSYGIEGSSPVDRVARTGSCTFTLSNHQDGARAAGRWSPDHRDAITGWDIGIVCRIGLHLRGQSTYKKYYIDAIQPSAGIYGDRVVVVSGVDLLDHYARYRLRGLTVQTNKRSDELFTTIYTDVAQQPDRVSIAEGQDTYAYALDNLREESATAMSAFQMLAQSELGYIAVKRDAISGETLLFEDRHSRSKATASNAFTFRGDTDGLTLERNRAGIYNVVSATAHLRRVDTSDVVLWAKADNALEIQAAETIRPFGPYRDPDQEGSRIGGTSMVTAAATTDFLLNTAADGSGSNVTGSCSVTATYSATGVRWEITNNTGATAYVTKLQCRGRGLYDYAEAHMEATDTASASTYGERAMGFDMPYQDEPRVAQGAADYLLGMFKDPVTTVQSISYVANRNEILAQAAMDLDISDRIGLVEDQTGIDVDVGIATRGHFINACQFERAGSGVVRVGYTLVPSEAVSFWILEDAAASVLGTTTVCGYL